MALTGTGEKPFLEYEVDEVAKKLRILRTYVPPRMRGRGLARILLEEALSFARERGLSVEPLCSYALQYFVANREARDMLIEELRGLSDEELKRALNERRSWESSENRG
ncbi:MAG: GNAT family N-acetyltransferase [Fervidicoccaceae archaeon]